MRNDTTNKDFKIPNKTMTHGEYSTINTALYLKRRITMIYSYLCQSIDRFNVVLPCSHREEKDKITRTSN